MQQLFNKKALIDAAITTHLDQELINFQQQQLAKPLFSLLKVFVVKGKTVRGGLFLSYLEAANPQFYLEKQSELLKIAAALEIIHAGILAHDDVIDQDEQRRGSNSVWQEYRLQAEAANYHDPINYGKNQAICVGSICQYLANQLIEQTTIGKLINQEITKTYLAEMLDSQITANPEIPSIETVLELYQFKTARYTFGLPLKLAATILQTSTKDTHVLEQISNAIGLIFQIQDDLIGLLENSEKSGKPLLSDIREGKKTIVYLQLLRNCDEAETTLLHTHFGKQQQINQEDGKALQNLIHSKALPDIKIRLQTLANETKELINSLDDEGATKNLLQDLLHFNLSRDY